MTISIGIDIGTTNSLISIWSEAAQRTTILQHPSAEVHLHSVGEDEPIYLIPSRVELHPARISIGTKAAKIITADNFGPVRGPYRNFKRGLLKRIQGHDFARILRLFTGQLLGELCDLIDPVDARLVMTYPIEAPDAYRNILREAAHSAHINCLELVAEPVAAAIGMGHPVQDGDQALIVDVGGGTTDIAWVSYYRRRSGEIEVHALGTAAATDVCGNNVDEWIVSAWKDEQSDFQRAVAASEIAPLEDARRAKEQLSKENQVSIQIYNDHKDRTFAFNLTHNHLVSILEQHDLYFNVSRAVRQALSSPLRGENRDLAARGCLKYVLLTGGSSQLPELQDRLKRDLDAKMCSSIEVICVRPFTTVTRGAAMLARGYLLHDITPREYFLRHYTNRDDRYGYLTRIIRVGTRSPQFPIVEETIVPIDRLLTISVYEAAAHISSDYPQNVISVRELGEEFDTVFNQVGSITRPLDETRDRGSLTLRLGLDSSRILTVSVQRPDASFLIDSQPLCHITPMGII